MRTLCMALILSPTVALAVGTGEDVAPTETTTICDAGLVYDSDTKSCVAPKDSRLHDDTRYRAARELAHAGRFEEAQAALAAMTDQQADRVLTYWGYTYRRMGDMDTGMTYYRKALARNPDNLEARSYMGQALLEQNDFPGARAQLMEIVARGGAGSRAERQLRAAMLSGSGYTDG